MRRPRYSLTNRLANAFVAAIALLMVVALLMACWAPAYVGATDRQARLADRHPRFNRLMLPTKAR